MVEATALAAAAAGCVIAANAAATLWLCLINQSDEFDPGVVEGLQEMLGEINSEDHVRKLSYEEDRDWWERQRKNLVMRLEKHFADQEKQTNKDKGCLSCTYNPWRKREIERLRRQGRELEEDGKKTTEQLRKKQDRQCPLPEFNQEPAGMLERHMLNDPFDRLGLSEHRRDL